MLEKKQEKLFFIIGPGRAGTSVLQEIMNTFSSFCNIRESRIPPKNMLSCWMPVRKEKDFSYLEKFIEVHWTTEYFVEKTPDSILCLPEALDRFPNSNYIFLERNPRKIVLSQLNKHPLDKDGDLNTRKLFVKNLIMSEKDLNLNLEQFTAKRILRMIRYQVENKEKFKNMITIRYENLVRSLDSELKRLENQFHINANYAEARECFSHSSYSSKDVRYDIKDLKDMIATELVKQACKLWNYDQNF